MAGPPRPMWTGGVASTMMPASRYPSACRHDGYYRQQRPTRRQGHRPRGHGPWLQPLLSAGAATAVSVHHGVAGHRLRGGGPVDGLLLRDVRAGADPVRVPGGPVRRAPCVAVRSRPRGDERHAHEPDAELLDRDSIGDDGGPG